MTWGPSSPDEPSSLAKARTGVRLARGRGADPSTAIEEFDPDLIHIHNLFPNISTHWTADCQVPLVMSIHNYRSICANGVLFRDGHPCSDCLAKGRKMALRYSCYRNSVPATASVLAFQQRLRRVIDHDLSLLIYTSSLSQSILAAELSPSKSVVIPNFVPPVRASEFISQSDVEAYFVVVSRLSPEKGVAELLEIWPKDRKLIIVGEGPERLDLESQAKTMNVQFRGFLDAVERDDLVHGAAGLVLPSLTKEADPVVVALALSAGTPCVVRSGTASAELARCTPSVQLFSDSASLAEAIQAVEQPASVQDATRVYGDLWSAESWLSRYQQHVLARLTTQAQ